MRHTEIVPDTVTPIQIPFNANVEQKIVQCIRYIKLLSSALIIIAALCIVTIAVLSWNIVKSESQEMGVKRNSEILQNINETITAQLMDDVRKLKDDANTGIEDLMQQILAKVVPENNSADIRSLQNVVKKQGETIQNLETTLKELSSESATYTRWGRSDCPANGTDLVYDGYVGGSMYNHKGGASNFVCLTKQPLWGHVQNGTQSHAMIYGAEYQSGGHTDNGKDFFGEDLVNFDVPCAVCRTTRPTVIMIPGRNRCFDGWTLEYHGYLTADYFDYLPTEYACMDNSPTTVTENNTDENGVLFYVVEAVCGSLKCPPYIDGGELTCVVCSK